MTLASGLAERTAPTARLVGEPAVLTLVRPDATTLPLKRAEPEARPRTLGGTVHGVDGQALTANVTHGPLARIGMPGMTMGRALGGA